MKILCFGTFGHILRQCKLKSVSDPALIGTITRTVDPNCQYIKQENKGAVSNLLRCKSDLPRGLPNESHETGNRGVGQALSNVVREAVMADKNTVVIKFRESILPLLNEDKKEALVLALLSLIEEDKSIDEARERSFVKHIGSTKKDLLAQAEFFLDELLAGIFLYTTASDIDNREGRDSVSAITGEYIVELENTRGIKVFDFCPFTVAAKEVCATTEPDYKPGKDYDILGTITGNQHVFKEYLQNAAKKYGAIKTLLYSNEPRPFYDFYVCNDIERQVRKTSRFGSTSQIITIKDMDFTVLSGISRFVILTGTGGLGKSMMMRHLLLNCVENFDLLGVLPIFIPVKDFDDTVTSLFDYVYSRVVTLSTDFTEALLLKLLENGRCLVLFDGLDEINLGYDQEFEKELEKFTDSFPDNYFVISSRPYQGFISFSRFSILRLDPFTHSQALELIDRLEFRVDEPAIKEKFREALGKRLYFSHRAFTENPLLLTIMLLTFEQYAEVPSKMHVFYREAFSVLSSKHDASKGAYQRTLKTGLTSHRFEDYFAEFCWHSYYKGKFELTEDEFTRIYSALKEPKKVSGEAATAINFLYDLCSNMCLMYLDGGKYHFIHRSFQEYFCALFLSKQKDRFLREIGSFFESRGTRIFFDKTFEMLYDMIPDKIEEYIFIPFLTDLFENCDRNSGYATFLETMYPHIQYELGEINEFIANTASSFLFIFIKRLVGFYSPKCKDFPHYDSLVETEYVWAVDEDEEEVLITLDELDCDYEIEYGTPDIAGRVYGFHIEELWGNEDDYGELLDRLNNEDSDFKKEYIRLREYLDELREKQNPVGDNLLELL